MLNYRKYYEKKCRLDPESTIKSIEYNVKRGIYSREYADQLISKINTTHNDTTHNDRA